MKAPAKVNPVLNQGSFASSFRLASVLALVGIIPSLSNAADAKPAAKVSYYREIRPILQANCQGCHQPAKNKGGYIMTEFKRLLAGGDNEGAAIVPAHADKS